MASFGSISIPILLILKLILYAFYVIQQLRGWAEVKLSNLFGAVTNLNALILGAAGLFAIFLRGEMPESGNNCKTGDADLIGRGAFYGIFFQEILLTIIATVGFRHKSPNAMKEVGSGFLITHISLIIALVIPLACRKPLSVVDAILGSMILDSQNAALSIQLSSKETLASRWQVAMTLIVQTIGLVALAVIVDLFSRGMLLDNNKCDCFPIFWWGWITNCPKTTPTGIWPFWVYFALRSLIVLQFAIISMSRTGEFHEAEKEDRQKPCARSQTCGTCFHCERCYCMRRPCVPCVGYCPDCRRCIVCGRLRQRIPGFSHRDATSSKIFFEAVALALVSFLGLQATITDNGLSPTSDVYSIGQITAISIGAVTFLRSGWVFMRG